MKVKLLGLVLSLLIMTLSSSAFGIHVNIYEGYNEEGTGGGAPYSNLAGSLESGEIMFATNTSWNWHPFELENFGAEITGWLHVSSTGTYEFTLTSDDGSMLYIDNTLIIDNGGEHGPVSMSGTAQLTAGVHPFKIEFFECCGDPSGIDLSLPPGISYTESSFGIHVNIYEGYVDEGTGGGAPYSNLVGSLESGEIMFATNTDWNWHPFELENFGAEITGWLQVSSTGTYEFTLTSDDGSMLYIDNTLIIDNGGEHGPVSMSGTAQLTAGVHPFKIEFFECCSGPSGVDLSLPPGISYTESSSIIQLDQFSAVPQDDQIIINWTTLSEIDNAGFNLWRSESKSGKYVKINPKIIESEGGATLKAEYTSIDNTAKPGVTYYYKLEDIDTKGVSTFHGPVSAMIPATKPNYILPYTGFEWYPAWPLGLFYDMNYSLCWPAVLSTPVYYR